MAMDHSMAAGSPGMFASRDMMKPLNEPEIRAGTQRFLPWQFMFQLGTECLSRPRVQLLSGKQVF
jgi:hypothetical protein